MKRFNYFSYALSTLILMAFTQSVSAHILFSYKTAEMDWISEKTYSQDGTPVNIDFLWDYTFQFDVSFVTPDLDFHLEEMETKSIQVDNPVLSVSTSAPFQTISIENSIFLIEAFKVEGNIYKNWYLTFDILDSNLSNDTVMSASIYSSDSWDYMKLRVEDLHYSRANFNAIIDINAEFLGEYNGEYSNEYPDLGRLIAKYIAVPEPSPPALILLGLASIFAVRKMKGNKLSQPNRNSFTR
jgi:hypothetical protein